MVEIAEEARAAVMEKVTPLCVSCAWWERDYYLKRGGRGICTVHGYTEGYSDCVRIVVEIGGPDSEGGSVRAQMETGPDFFCKHWQVRDDGT